TKNQGAFEYSLDGSNYQDQNVFENREGGQYTIYVRGKDGCGLATLEYLHLVIPKFFTPNGDNHNDLFIINGTHKFQNSYLNIFNRYGTLLLTLRDAPLIWDGTLKNQALLASDYSYSLQLVNITTQGHLTVKR